MSDQQGPPRLVVKPSSTTNTKSNRLPAPTLFVGPPSLNASQISVGRNPTPDFLISAPQSNDKSSNLRENNLVPTYTNSTVGTTGTVNNNSLRPARTPLERTRSGLSYRANAHLHTPTSNNDAINNLNLATTSNPNNNHKTNNGINKPRHDLQIEQPLALPSIRKPSDRSLDAKWRDMQLALNEVELTAQSTTQVFNTRHAAALDELRRTQIDLAHAWGRGNEDAMAQPPPASNTGGAPSKGKPTANPETGGDTLKDIARKDFAAAGGGGGPGIAVRKRAATNTSASTALSDESLLTDETGDSNETEDNIADAAASRMGDETAQDIRLAAERRAANERYFRQVDQGVKDVVAKLQAVAAAMKGVEAESRSLWSRDSESEMVSLGDDSGGKA